MVWLAASAPATVTIGPYGNWESPLIVASGDRMLVELRFLGKYPPQLNVKRIVSGAPVYNPNAIELSMRRQSPDVWIGGGEVDVPDLYIMAYNDRPVDGTLTWSVRQWDGGGGGFAGRDRSECPSVAGTI